MVDISRLASFNLFLIYYNIVCQVYDNGRLKGGTKRQTNVTIDFVVKCAVSRPPLE